MTALRRLGLDVAQVTAVTPMQHREGRRLDRITYGQRTFVLKRFTDTAPATEVQAYALLRAAGVPTLRVHAHGPDALLLEDLATSSRWRQAAEGDIATAAVGTAAAGWYRALHAAGRALLASGRVPACFTRESDALDAPTILSLGRRLDLMAHPVWALAAASVDRLQQAVRSLPQTLTYNDFHWTNLALARATEPAAALVYDYHLLGVGMAHSDVRNVLSVLRGDAARAFTAAYGATDPAEALLDAPLATLAALAVAVDRPRFPAWAVPLRRSVVSGALAADLGRALAFLDRPST